MRPALLTHTRQLARDIEASANNAAREHTHRAPFPADLFRRTFSTTTVLERFHCRETDLVRI